MKLLIKITITLTLFLFPYFLYSQLNYMNSCYIINNYNDTIWGKGYVYPLQKYCLFQPVNVQTSSQYSPDEITCLRFKNGKNYVSREIIIKKVKDNIFEKDTIIFKHEKYFLEYLLDGKVDLFVLHEFDKKRYFIEKSDMPISELKFSESIIIENGIKYTYVDPRLKGFLLYYMSDSPSIQEQVTKLKLINQKSLINLSEEYHYRVCPDEECINYTKKLFWAKSRKKE